GQVVGAEAEEFRLFGDFFCRDCGTRHFDHGADEVFDLDAILVHHFAGDTVDDFQLVSQLGRESYQRDHDLRAHFHRCLGTHDAGSGFEDGANLHFGDFRIEDAETAATAAEHRVLFVQRLDPFDDELQRQVQPRSELAAHGIVLWLELVQGRVEPTNGYRTTLHGLEQADEALALEG